MAVTHAKRSGLIRFSVMMLLCVLILSGCGLLDESKKYGALPEPPVSFTQQEYDNPDNPEDGYMAVEYNGRLYVPFGTLRGIITPKDVKECIGYVYREEFPDDTNSHLYTLVDDPEVNFLMDYYVNSIMEQPDFYRAIDTRGREIDIPSYIESLDYDVWK